MNSECHYLVVISVAKCSGRHYILPQISLPSSDVHYSFLYSEGSSYTLVLRLTMLNCEVLTVAHRLLLTAVSSGRPNEPSLTGPMENCQMSLQRVKKHTKFTRCIKISL